MFCTYGSLRKQLVEMQKPLVEMHNLHKRFCKNTAGVNVFSLAVLMLG
jgi:hypothetical protein